MKKLLLIMSLLLVNQGYAVVKTHNFTINFGGGYDYFKIQPSKKDGVTDAMVDAARAKYSGGGFNVELGYLYYHVLDNDMVYGADTRVGFTATFADMTSYGGINVKEHDMDIQLNGYSGSIGSTFQLGQVFTGEQLKNSRIKSVRFMADIIGFSLGGSTLYHTNSIDKNRLGDNFNLGFILPGGFQTVFENGFMVGLRHKLEFVVPVGKSNMFTDLEGKTTSNIINYNIYANIGYAIGLK